MLKIKFNINKFTIIFLRRFEGKNEHKRISFSLYQLQRLPSFLFSLCSVQHLPFLLAFIFFSVHVLPFFFSPKTFFSAQNNSLFSPKPFSVQPKTFFQPKTILSSAQNLFQFSPKHCSFVRASFSFI